MAQTAKQKAALEAQLKAAQAAIAQTKKTIANLSPPKTPALTDAQYDRKKTAEAAAAKAAAIPTQTQIDNTWATTKVGTTGKTQAQLDAAAGAAKTAEVINASGDGITSVVAPTGIVKTKDADGNPIGSDHPIDEIVTPKKPEISAETRDAFELLKLLFRSYDLEDLAGEIEGYMTEGLSANAALLKLKTNPTGKYAERFAGNLARNKNGLNVVTEAEYLDLEKSYAQTLKSYGLGSMISTDKKQNWKNFATYIENDISALEFKDRIDTVQKRVVNADPATKELFKKWYPSITDSDLVSYFLNPKETIDKLKTKTTTAEIGAAFAGQNLMTSMESANELAKYGIDRAGALDGASNIAEVLPVSQKLGDIYGETGVKYDQQAGVDEFLKSNAEAKRKRETLKSKERASFSGSAGVGKNAFSGPNI